MYMFLSVSLSSCGMGLHLRKGVSFAYIVNRFSRVLWLSNSLGVKKSNKGIGNF